MITPREFAKLLKRSTLSFAEQMVLLRKLPTLSHEHIQRLGMILQHDVVGQERVLGDMIRKRDTLLLKFNLDVSKFRKNGDR